MSLLQLARVNGIQEGVNRGVRRDAFERPPYLTARGALLRHAPVSIPALPYGRRGPHRSPGSQAISSSSVQGQSTGNPSGARPVASAARIAPSQ